MTRVTYESCRYDVRLIGYDLSRHVILLLSKVTVAEMPETALQLEYAI